MLKIVFNFFSLFHQFEAEVAVTNNNGFIHFATILALLVVAFGIGVFTSPALASFPALLEADCRTCHGASLSDRHHLMAQDSGIECLTCHPMIWDSTISAYVTAKFRDCLICHVAKEEHHTVAVQQKVLESLPWQENPPVYVCFECHVLVFNPETSEHEMKFPFTVQQP
ncbi:MAG TPA: hypothetical protein VIR78_08190 [Malonomonas sp.]